MKNTMKCLGIIALAALIGFAVSATFTACGDDSGSNNTPGGGYTPTDSGRDSRLVCTGNEAWVDSYPVGNRDGFVFKADGSFQIIDDYNGSSVGVWAIYGTGSWTTSGNNTLTISGGGGSATYSYTITGNTLRIFNNSTSETFTKTTITIGGGAPTHTHTWGAWQSNTTQHWRVCTVCGEENGRASHSGNPCSVCGYSSGPNLSLDGVWLSDTGNTITISGSTGVFTQFGSHAGWQSAVNRGLVKVGDQAFRNLTKTGDLRWTGQLLSTDMSWYNCTITMNANGQTFQTTGSTYTRQ
jgi:hypothetical protein